MADNVEITAGTGTTISTDDAGASGHVQRVKLTYSADGSATHIAADADGLLVNLGTNNDVTVTGTVTANLAAGTNNIGDVDVLSLPAIPAGTNNIGDVDVLTVPAPLSTTGGGTEATALRVTVATDSTGVLSVDDNGGSLTVDNSGTFAVQATLVTGTTGGASTMNASSSDGGTALTSTAQAIKASAGTLYGYYIYNPNSSAQFVQFYNTAQGSVTVGTTNPLFMLTIPAASAANMSLSPHGIAFGTAMSWAATSTAGGNGAPTTALDAICWYA